MRCKLIVDGTHTMGEYRTTKQAKKEAEFWFKYLNAYDAKIYRKSGEPYAYKSYDMNYWSYINR